MMLLSLVLGGLFVGLFVGWLTIRILSDNLPFGPPDYHGVVMPSPKLMSDFTLTSSSGEQVSLSDYRDKVALLYFGYTYCPDVCPATLGELAKARRELEPEEREAVQVIMVSVDPERDTPETLGQYLSHFDPSFVGLTGTEEELAAATKPFGIFYQKNEGSVESGYLLDHTATVAALDKDGYLRLIYHFNTPGEDIAADLKRLVDE